MLSLNNPTMLHVSAEREVLDELKAGVLTPGAMMGVDLLKKKQEMRFDAGWNGWWTCLLPAEIISDGWACRYRFSSSGMTSSTESERASPATRR